MTVNNEKEIEAVETELEDRSFARNPLAYIAYITGLISIGTDLLAIFAGIYLFFDALSLILELTAIGTGIVALALKQNKRIALNGVLLGAIGIAIRLIFPLIF